MDWLRPTASLLFTGFVLAACGGDTFASSGDAGATDDGGRCDYGDRRTPASRGCTQDSACAVVMHALSCCQVQAQGINHAFVTEFNAAEAANTSGCSCTTGCAAQTIDEENKVGTNFTAKCESNVCVALVQ